ncbi:MAG: DUF262 domain-containing protein [Deltaproteobacteria bacterium]|nr:DUF262 domain-containing protein [Deltaproteobacteria bacterium]
MPTLFDNPSVPTLVRLLEEVRSGQILLPDFQRPFVWKDQQRLDLLDSIARGVPIGSLLVWRTRAHLLQTHEALGPHKLPLADPDRGPWTYLIDGRQRLTTLFAALTPVDDPEITDAEEGRWPLLLDLDNPYAPTFQIPRTSLRRRPTLVPTTVLLSNRLLYTHQQALWREGLDREAEVLEQVAWAFRDYTVPVVPMLSEELSTVTTAFARVNTGGTPMSEAHLAMALAYGRVPLREELATTASLMQDLGWGVVDEGALLNLLKLRFDLDVYRADIQALLQSIRDSEHLKALGHDLLEDAIAASTSLGLHGVHGGAALPYKYQLLILAEAIRRRSADGLAGPLPLDPVHRWLWQTTLTEWFTGATGKTIRQSLKMLLDMLDGRPSPLEGTAVREMPHQQRWGAVRAMARVLIRCEEARRRGHDQPAQLLGERGAGALHKLAPELDNSAPAAWVVATPDELRGWRDRRLVPDTWSAQFSADADFTRLQQGEEASARFLSEESAAILALERAFITSVGLVVQD